ncbi:YbaY family lipoprotein [Ramlibacter sp.]|uniref:YbaY family lipoprotein n=1 Tax=Ramlibacter sp. TaxID=1917967 RepID=UPI002D48DA6F|nr:YbaY family lipoprotein [Ramlibacter sp.]HYD75992.1 YbaY family lipoprotein [Ramlibacter sp.]
MFVTALRRRRSFAALALLLSACTLPIPPAGQALLTGTATYRERMALPPGAQFEATIENVWRADASAVPVAGTRQPVTGVPIQFAIAYDPALLRPGERYGVRARIRAGDGAMLFATDRAYPLPLPGPDGQAHVDLLLRRAAGQPPAARSLVGLYLYLADAAVFTDCTSGTRWPVAAEGAAAALERAYLAARRAPGVPALATVEAHVAERPRIEGPGQQPMLIVQRVLSVQPQSSCAP